MIEPMIEALTTSCRPWPSAKSAMISSGALPKVTLSRPPMPGPERAASSSVARPISAAVGMIPSAEAAKTSVGRAARQLERDRDRDERRAGRASHTAPRRKAALAKLGCAQSFEPVRHRGPSAPPPSPSRRPRSSIGLMPSLRKSLLSGLASSGAEIVCSSLTPFSFRSRSTSTLFGPLPPFCGSISAGPRSGARCCRRRRRRRRGRSSRRCSLRPSPRRFPLRGQRTGGGHLGAAGRAFGDFERRRRSRRRRRGRR